jgi:hypothetical protein
MSLKDTLKRMFTDFLGINEVDKALQQRIDKLAELKDYYDGLHKQQLRVKAGKFNDNLSINLCGLVVDKAVSALVGDPSKGNGMRWEFPSETTVDPKTNKKVRTDDLRFTWLDEIWNMNNKEILLHKNAMSGAYSGAPAFKIVTDGMGGIRLINLNPMLWTVETDPQDQELVTKYIIRYVVVENGKEVAYREESINEGSRWVIETKRQISGNRWENVLAPVLWDYDFPPILDWQNLPDETSYYGRSDIESIIPIQDRFNFQASNISKIIRLYAHPQRMGINISNQIVDGQLAMGPDEMPLLQGEGRIEQMTPIGDLPGSMQYMGFLRELMFMLSREIDFTKVNGGDMSNYDMEVLCKDFLDKLGTKRMLYGNAYTELNRRLLILGNHEPEECKIYWPDPLPVNQAEETQALEADLRMGLVSKQTLMETRGYDHEQETARMMEEKTGTENAGAMLLNNFFKAGK